jgi:GT2 family glycosyltransferase
MYAEDNEWCLRVTRAGWRLVFEPAAAVVHHGSHFSLRRWGSREKLRRQLESALRFQRLSLSRRHRIANLAAGCLVMTLHGWRGRLGRQPTGDVALCREMYLADLKRTLREH